MSYIKKTDKKTPWGKKETYNRRPDPQKIVKQTFLIYCEGKNTEPNYFRSFPVSSETTVEAIGLGRTKLSLVNYILAELKKKEFLTGQKNYDPDRQIWCVFDHDVKGIKNENNHFNDAIALGEKNGVQIAYSNDSFELWFVLHDKYIDVQQTRHQYYEHLSKKFGVNYENDGKAARFSKTVYELLLAQQKVAIKHATALQQSHANKKHCDKNPCTTVHKLVIELNKFLKK